MTKTLQGMKKILAVAAGVGLLVFIALGAHLFAIQNKISNADLEPRLARIDFNKETSCQDLYAAKERLAQLKGIQNVYLNEEDAILVYAYVPKFQSPEMVYKKILLNQKSIATPYRVDEKSLKSGCPIKSASFVENFYKNIFKAFNH